METDASILTKIFDFISWLKANLRQVIIGTLIAVVVIITVSMILYNRGQREIRASLALSNIHPPTDLTKERPPGLPEAYLQVAKDYPGTKAAMRAMLDAGQEYFVQGKYKEAEQQFDTLLRNFPESPFRSEVIHAQGRTFEAQGKTNEAIAKYEDVRKNPAAAGADQAKLDVARLYEGQGKNIEALKLYDELLKFYQFMPYSGIGAEAGMRLVDLTNRIPDLATNLAPPVPPTPAPTTVTSITNDPAAMSNFMWMRTNPVAVSNRMWQMTNPAAVSNRLLQMTNLGAVATGTPPAAPASAPTNAPK
jgi:tetratricopeptide (TPR) repeat protein